MSCKNPAINGLYNLSVEDMLAILDSNKRYSTLECSSVVCGVIPSEYISQSLTRYHTVEFHNLKDVVFFWHRVWRHASEKQMIKIVGDEKHPSVFKNIPRELTAAVIRKHFRHLQCLDCPLGNLHLRSSPTAKPHATSAPGAHWQADYKKYSGSDDIPIIGMGGKTHTFSAIDHETGRVFGYPTVGTAKCVTHLQNLYEFNKRRGYIMESFTCDPEFQTRAVIKFCQEAKPPIKLCVAITDEHFAIGEIERWHRNVHESMLKASVSNPYLTNPMWPLLYDADLDMYNSLPTARNPHQSPYQLFDKIVIDLRDSPTLPIGTIVVGHIPLNKQSLRVPGRGIPTVVVGRSPMGFGGVKLYNPATNKCIVRRTLKFVGDHPAQGFLFSKPLVLDISDERI